jgi:hypothetical protein
MRLSTNSRVARAFRDGWAPPLGALLLGLVGACTQEIAPVPTAGTGGAGGSGNGGAAGSQSAGSSGSAGSAGTSGTAGTVGSAGGAGAGSGGGTAGGAGGIHVGGAGGGAGLGGAPGCVPGKYVICEDFESTAVGAIPTGWTKHGGTASVAADQAARGSHALKVTPAANGERRIYMDATHLGSGHWGRVFYRVQVPAPISCDPANSVLHSTFVALEGVGPVNGAEEVRVVDTVENAQGMHQWLYNVQPTGAEFGTGSAYNWKYDGNWHCAEWHIDNPTQSYHFYLDSTEVTSIAINNGLGNYAGSDIPPSFSQVRIGLYNYQLACSPYLTVWLDEVALDTNRITCGG